MARFVLLASTLTSLITSASLYADQLTAIWNGGTGNWNTATNWSPGKVPNNGADTYLVLIDNGKADSIVTLNINSSIDGLTLDPGDVLDVNQNLTLSVLSTVGLTNHGQININIPPSFNLNSGLFFGGTQTIGGTGEIVMTATRIRSGNVLTHGPDHTIRGSGRLLANSGEMINNGTIIADQAGLLVVDPGPAGFINNSTMRATGSGGYSFVDGTITNNSVVEILTGSKLILDEVVTVVGGTLRTAGSGIVINQDNNTIDGITLDGTMNHNFATLTVVGGLVNDGHLKVRNSSNTNLFFDGAQTISGSGEVMLGENVTNASITANGMVTNGANHTIRGRGRLLDDSGGMVNDGTVLADQPHVLTIDPNELGFANRGITRATGSAGLRLTDGLFTNHPGGQLVADSLVNLTSSGTLINAEGGVLAGTGVFQIDGTLNQLGIIAPGNSTGTLTFTNSVTNQESSTLEIEIAAKEEADRLAINGTATLTGTLTVELLDGGSGPFLPHFDDTYTILTAAELTGSFNNVAQGARLITLGGEGSFLVDYDYSIGQVVLSDFLLAVLPGDYNRDRLVNAADYVKWRDGDGSASAYEVWRANFGATGSGALNFTIEIPEPTSGTLLWLLLAAGVLILRSSAQSGS